MWRDQAHEPSGPRPARPGSKPQPRSTPNRACPCHRISKNAPSDKRGSSLAVARTQPRTARNPQGDSQMPVPAARACCLPVSSRTHGHVGMRGSTGKATQAPPLRPNARAKSITKSQTGNRRTARHIDSRVRRRTGKAHRPVVGCAVARLVGGLVVGPGWVGPCRERCRWCASFLRRNRQRLWDRAPPATGQRLFRSESGSAGRH